MTTFQEMALPSALSTTLENMQFNEPTPIQAQAIPLALEGKDILGSAQTGTGKTAAFGIPIIARLLDDPQSAALVMTPTRELAAQVMRQLQLMLGKKSKVNTALLIGGDPMGKQMAQLRGKPRIVVGTPGRINDHLQRKSLSLKHTNFLVLDETDRMLDMGFTEQIETILERMPEVRQTLLFSATLPRNIERIANQYLSEPVRIAVSGDSQPAANIKQDTIKLKESEKYDQLVEQIKQREGSIIIFLKTKIATEKMAVKLSKENIKVEAIHGNLRQRKRDRVIAGFRQKKYRILCATDVAARGLDIPHIEHVINYDLPQCAEDYVHRIGRTARAGAEGEALSFITPGDYRLWSAIDRLINPNAKPKDEPRRNSNSKRKPNGYQGKKPSENYFKKRKFKSKKANGEGFSSSGKRPFKAKVKPKKAA